MRFVAWIGLWFFLVIHGSDYSAVHIGRPVHHSHETSLAAWVLLAVCAPIVLWPKLFKPAAPEEIVEARERCAWPMRRRG